MDDKLLIELDYYPLEMAARKTGLTEDDLILLAAQDKLKVCVLMPQNKTITRFLADSDLYEKELPCCFSSLCKVPALTFKNYLADNSTPLDIVKSCEEDGVYYRLKDDEPLKDMRLVVMADDIKQFTVSNAPKPITPLSGARYIHKPTVIPPANYEKWCKADLWTVERGILLLLKAEVLPSRNTSTGRCNSDDEQRLYDELMKIWAIAESSLTAGTLKRIGKSFPHFTSQVLPSVFIEWAKLKGYPIPDELGSIDLLPQAETVASVGAVKETPVERQSQLYVFIWRVHQFLNAHKKPTAQQLWAEIQHRYSQHDTGEIIQEVNGQQILWCSGYGNEQKLSRRSFSKTLSKIRNNPPF